jgi:uncharacterized protein with NAD-binding domain and iron-sulfur cluster
MAGLVTAWELSRGDWRERYSSITIYQRGWRLGGKGASSRGPHGRIEEHGLHVLLGYYDATFRVLREVYAELDRPQTDPNCPILTWRDAFAPSPAVGLADVHEGEWDPFVTRFSTNDALPGEPGAEDRVPSPLDLATRAVQMLVDFHRSLAGDAGGGVFLSAHPHPPRVREGAVLQGIWLTGLATALEGLRLAAETAASFAAVGPFAASASDVLRSLTATFADALRGDAAARRTWHLVDLVVANLRGMLVDGLLAGPDRLSSIDHLDYREWLRRHGADEETIDSPIVRGMYDLVFAFEDGDRSRPRFAAGLGLHLAGRMLFDFKGAIFWKMLAGMGEVVMAPLYEALRRRGLEFRFFHRVDRVRPGADGDSIEAVELGLQAGVRDGAGAYEPLVRIGGLPCWPAAPLDDQLTAPAGADLETLWSSHEDTGDVVLAAGKDFDLAVFAISVGMVPHVCPDIVASNPRWQTMVEQVRTVPTQSFQLWLRPDEPSLGWRGGAGVTLSGYVAPFDTWASMSHLLVREAWPHPGPQSIAYFCSVLDDVPRVDGIDAAAAAAARVRENAVGFLDRHVAALWPAAADDRGFRWDLLWTEPGSRTDGAERFDAQYWRANVDPSDRYVQSVPGSGVHRIAPDDSGYRNLVLAGDWTACGLDAGCVEAATRSGVLAARAVAARAAGAGVAP